MCTLPFAESFSTEPLPAFRVEKVGLTNYYLGIVTLTVYFLVSWFGLFIDGKFYILSVCSFGPCVALKIESESDLTEEQTMSMY